jgi:hypothetical protein
MGITRKGVECRTAQEGYLQVRVEESYLRKEKEFLNGWRAYVVDYESSDDARQV